MNEPLVWAEVDLDAYDRNIATLRERTHSGAKLLAVVKADGYGHGSVAVSRRALAGGGDALGVARIDEALELRRAGIKAPILVFGLTPPERADELIDHRLEQTVCSLPVAKALSARAVARGTRIPVHLKVDTGMSRLGLVAGSATAATEAKAIALLQGLEPTGIFTHFATADSEDRAAAELQLEAFLAFVEGLRRDGVEFPVRHAANSAALFTLPDSHLEMVRPGIATYGLSPSPAVTDSAGLDPVMQLKSRIVQIKRLPVGVPVSYGATYQTSAPTTIATVAVGYGDGVPRVLSSRGAMLVRGKRAPIIGRICMDSTMLDVSDVQDAAAGDEVVVFGRQGEEQISVDEIATLAGTINYEIVSALPARVPRVYRN